MLMATGDEEALKHFQNNVYFLVKTIIEGLRIERKRPMPASVEPGSANPGSREILVGSGETATLGYTATLQSTTYQSTARAMKSARGGARRRLGAALESLRQHLSCCWSVAE